MTRRHVNSLPGVHGDILTVSQNPLPLNCTGIKWAQIPLLYFVYANILETNSKAELVLIISLSWGWEEEDRIRVNVHSFKLVATEIKCKVPLKCRKCSISRPSAANTPASLETVLCHKLGTSPKLQLRDSKQVIFTPISTFHSRSQLMLS